MTETGSSADVDGLVHAVEEEKNVSSLLLIGCWIRKQNSPYLSPDWLLLLNSISIKSQKAKFIVDLWCGLASLDRLDRPRGIIALPVLVSTAAD